MKSAIFSDEIAAICKIIGENLKSFRINELNEKQDMMAKRVGVSRDTYIRMEKGDPSVKMGYWLEASGITQQLDQWRVLFHVEDDLFADFGKKKKVRQRVRG